MSKTKKEFKPGDVIKVKAAVKKELKERFEMTENIEATLLSMAAKLSKEKKDNWDFIYQLYPGIENFILSYSRYTGEILIKTRNKE